MSPVPWQHLPAALAPVMRPRLPETVRAIAEAIASAVPVFAAPGDAKVSRDVRTAVQAALDRFLELIGTADAALPPRIREVFVALGAAEAREDRGPEALLGALRLASRLMVRTASAALTELGSADSGSLIDLSDAVSVFVDELAAAATDGFALQVREQAGEGDRRRQLGEVLLRGGAAPDAVLGAAAGIGWRTIGAVVPVLLPPEQARDARFRYGPDGLVVERERDAVLLVRDGPRAGRESLADALHGRGAVVGPMLDWSRVPQAVRLAELTVGLVGTDAGAGSANAGSPNGDDAVFADDHLALLALRGEPGALTVLADRRLAPLAALRRTRRESLLVTLHSWLRHWGSRADVSAELYVHPQTVSYRLKRLRDLLGDDLDDPDARFELLLVLTSRRPGH
jgi:hypothetical protein